MRPTTQALEALLNRLDLIEKQNRKLKTAAIAALTLFGGVVLMGQAPPGSKTIDAQAVLVRDAEGSVRIKLQATSDGASIALYDPTSHEQVTIGTSGNGPTLTLRDPAGRKRAVLAAIDSGSSLEFFVADEKQGVALLSLEKIGNELFLSDANGEYRSMLSVLAGMPSLIFFDEGQRKRVELEAGLLGVASLSLYHPNGATKMAAMAAGEKGPLVILGDGRGSVLFEAPRRERGSVGP